MYFTATLTVVDLMVVYSCSCMANFSLELVISSFDLNVRETGFAFSENLLLPEMQFPVLASLQIYWQPHQASETQSAALWKVLEGRVGSWCWGGRLHGF